MEDDPLAITVKCEGCSAAIRVVFKGAQTAMGAGMARFDALMGYACKTCGKKGEVAISLRKPPA